MREPNKEKEGEIESGKEREREREATRQCAENEIARALFLPSCPASTVAKEIRCGALLKQEGRSEMRQVRYTKR